MLSKVGSRLTYANVVASLALFVALGGTAYAVNTVGSTDIIDGQVKSVDIGNNEIGSNDVKDNSINTFDVHSFLGADIADGSLEDVDVGEYTSRGTNLYTYIPNLPANNCVNNTVSLPARVNNDHVLLTPDIDDAHPALIYDARYSNSEAIIHVCNFTNATIDDAYTHYNLLVFDAD